LLFSCAAECSFFPSREDAGNIDDYLRFGAGARNLAMGRTGVAAPSGAETVCWNPAGLARMADFEATFMYNALFGGAYEYFAGQIIPTQWWGNFAVAALQLKVPDIQGWDSSNLSTGRIENESSAYFVSYGNSSYASPLELGGSLKIVHHNVAGYSDTGFGFDAGMIYNFSKCPVSVGAVYQNFLGPSIKLIDEKERFPASAKVGASARCGDFILALDAGGASRQSLKIMFGGEYLRLAPVKFRFGMNETEMTFGFGYEMKKVTVNYAYALHSAWDENMGSSHKFDVRFRFSGNLQKFKGGADRETIRAYKSARRLFRRGEYYYTVDALRKTLSLDNQHEDAALLMNKLSKKIDEGITGGRYTKFEDIAYVRGVISYINNDAENALNQLKQFSSVNPYNEEVKQTMKKLEDILRKEQEEKKEKERLSKIEQLLNDGIYLYSMEKYEEAAEKFRAALELDPANEDAKNYLDLCVKAIARLAEEKKLPPPRPSPKREKKAPAPAPPQEKVFERNPEKAESLYNDGLIEYSVGRLKNAINYWKMALKYDPDSKKIKVAIKNAEKKLQ